MVVKQSRAGEHVTNVAPRANLFTGDYVDIVEVGVATHRSIYVLLLWRCRLDNCVQLYNSYESR